MWSNHCHQWDINLRPSSVVILKYSGRSFLTFESIFKRTAEWIETKHFTKVPDELGAYINLAASIFPITFYKSSFTVSELNHLTRNFNLNLIDKSFPYNSNRAVFCKIEHFISHLWFARAVNSYGIANWIFHLWEYWWYCLEHYLTF